MVNLTSETRLQIVELMRRYASAVDARDWPTVKSCYFPDAYDDHGVVKGDREALVGHFAAALESFYGTLHLVGEPEIVPESDVRFAVRTPSLAFHWAKRGSGTKSLLMGALYDDIVEFRDGVGGIARRTVIVQDAIEYDGDDREWPLAKFFVRSA
ncbi:MAG: nuclear transport factor 2 family protein [Ilumatobacteraceae bacterium]